MQGLLRMAVRAQIKRALGRELKEFYRVGTVRIVAGDAGEPDLLAVHKLFAVGLDRMSL